MARISLEFYSKSLLRKTEVIVYIPTLNLQGVIRQTDRNYYQNANKQFPLMILLGGFGLSKTGWEQQSIVEDLADKYGVALCMVGGENKWYMNNSPIDMWEDFLCYELPDFLFGNFASLSRSNPLWIAGCSMGGYGALRNYLSHIEVFDACGVLSPATKADNNLEDILHQKSLPQLIEETKDLKKNVYLSVGTKDFIYEPSKEFDEFLTKTNCGFNYKFVEGYDHSFALWNIEIENFIKYALSLNK